MKGKNTFTQKEADEIKRCLEEIITLGRYDAVKEGNYLRTFCKFFKSDFIVKNKNFTSKDFDFYVSKGKIKIKD